jgi:predicted O-methyltransferase YrrM
MDTEDKFTTHITDLCPHPEYWHAPNDTATEYEVSVFIGGLVRLIQPEYVVETGTYQGDTSFQIGLALHLNGHGELDTIDNGPEEDYIQAQFKCRYDPLVANINFIRMNSKEFVPRKPIDLAFFDSSTQDRVHEFRRYYDMGMLKKHSIVAFHDAAPHHSVREAIEPLEKEGLVKFLWFNTPRGLAVGQVQHDREPIE